MLERDAKACVSCGSKIGDGEAGAVTSESASVHQPRADAMNRLHFQEDAKGGRSLDFSFTDSAMATVGQTAMYALESRIIARDGRPSARYQQRPSIEQLPLLPEPAESNGGSLSSPAAHVAAEAGQPDSLERMSREVWRLDRDAFKLDEPRLKAESKLDYARRLAVTLVYAHEVDGREPCPRSVIVAALEKHGVYDANVRTFLRTFAGFDRDDEGDNFRVNKEGREMAKNVLTRIFDAAVQGPGHMPDGRSGKAKEGDEKEALAKSAEKRGSGRRPSTKPKEWAQKWRANHGAIDAHGLLTKRSNAEKGMFGLWAIQKVAGESGKVVSELMLSKFLLEALVFKIETRTLARALQSKACSGKVIKVQGGFQLQPPGTKWASDLAAGKP